MLIQVPDAERGDLEDMLRICTPTAWKDNATPKYYKVNWTRVPDLVEKRRVYLRAGTAYVASQELSSVIFQQFQTDLENSLEVRLDHPFALLLTFNRQLPKLCHA